MFYSTIEVQRMLQEWLYSPPELILALGLLTIVQFTVSAFLLAAAASIREVIICDEW